MDQNVKRLLEAEQKANELVRAAILHKQERLKEAKIAAEREIEIFKTKLEADFEKEKSKRYGAGLNMESL